MNKTIKAIMTEVYKADNEWIKLGTPMPIEFEASITYNDRVDKFNIGQELREICFSSQYEDNDLLTFVFWDKDHEVCVDYDYKRNYTMVNYEYEVEDGYECMNDIIDKNIPIKVLRTILKAITK